MTSLPKFHRTFALLGASLLLLASLPGCAAASGALAPVVTVTTEKPGAPWTVDAIMQGASIPDVAASPDGRKVAWCEARPLDHGSGSDYDVRLFLSDHDGAARQQIDLDGHSARSPRWSPDGRWLSFLSNRNGEWNIYIYSTLEGGPFQVTDHSSSITDFKWSPATKMVAFLAAENNQAVRLWTLDVAGEVKPLTDNRQSVCHWDWSPDGSRIAFDHYPAGEQKEQYHFDISEVEVTTGKVNALLATPAGEAQPLYSPDGAYLACIIAGPPVEDFSTWRVNLLPLEGGPLKPLAAAPLMDGTAPMIGWAGDRQSIFCQSLTGTTSGVIRLPVDGTTAVAFSGQDRVISRPLMNPSRSIIGMVIEDAGTPPEAWLSPVDSYQPQKVSSANQALAGYSVPRTEVLRWRSGDGMVIEGLLVYPRDYQPGRRYPLLVTLHGGPAGNYYQQWIGSRDFFPVAVYASQGYAVLRPNVRGSTGYGPAFLTANLKDWGGRDYEDLMSGVERLVEMGVADPDLLGVMGWSYGGYLAAWAVGHTGRFKAAVVGGGPVNLVALAATTDLPDFLPHYLGGPWWKSPELYLTRSPMVNLRNIRTPTMIIHGEADTRVPFTQALELYRALTGEGVPVKLVSYPGAGHVPEEPRQLRDCLSQSLAWFSYYLPPGNGNPGV
jgi:dipeptidyl aminopeptidase/acylaminoacyl peptidase